MKLSTLFGLLLAAVGLRAADSNQSPAPRAPNPATPGPAAASTAVKHVDPAGAERLIQEKKVVVLDVRTPAEFQAGHLAGAKNIDFRAKDFEDNLKKLDRSQPYLVHCASGRRSTSALALFKQLGFKEVVHLDGGYGAWEKASKPTTK